MKTMRTVWLVIALILCSALSVEAQARDGVWFGFGLGGGWNTSEGLDDERPVGPAGYFRLGGTPSRNVLIGGEVLGWGRKDGDVTTTRGNVTATVMLFPSKTGGFFLKGGAGFAWVEATTDVLGGTLTAREEGFGTTLGAGFDVRLGTLYLTPNIDWLFQAYDAGQNLQETNTLFLITVGLTWH